MDSRLWAEVATEYIGACMETTQKNPKYLQGYYTIMKRWYCHTLARQPNPSHADLEKVSGDNTALYQREKLSPLGRPVPTHVYPLQIDDGVSTEAEVDAAVYRLRVNMAGDHMHLQANQFKTWLREALLSKNSDS